MNRVVTAILLLLASTAAVGQQTLYVTDELEVTLRRGEGMEYQILTPLTAGTQVEVLDRNRASGYARVRTPGGTVGFVLQRFLVEEAPARVRLPEVEADLEVAEAALAAQTGRAEILAGEVEALETHRDELLARVDSLEDELEALEAVSAQAMETRDERDRLARRVATLTDEVERLEASKAALREDQRYHWFLAGAGVLLGGVVIGLVLPRLGRRRRSEWSSL